jgi:hypothetical protein
LDINIFFTDNKQAALFLTVVTLFFYGIGFIVDAIIKNKPISNPTPNNSVATTNITDEMAHIAACEYLGLDHDSYIPDDNIKDMCKALEAAIQVAWVKFDINDKSTHPQHLQHVIVLYHTGTVGSDKWSILKTWV